MASFYICIISEFICILLITCKKALILNKYKNLPTKSLNVLHKDTKNIIVTFSNYDILLSQQKVYNNRNSPDAI